MPVHTKPIKKGKDRGKYVVEDDKGKVQSKPTTKAHAKDIVTARNIAGGHVPGLKPKKKKKD